MFVIISELQTVLHRLQLPVLLKIIPRATYERAAPFIVGIAVFCSPAATRSESGGCVATHFESVCLRSYSDRRALTGLVKAVRMAWKLTVSQAMALAISPDSGNSHQPMSTW